MEYLTGLDKIFAQKQLFLAANVAKNSTCFRSQCGSVIVSQDSIVIGSGYNSPPQNCTLERCLKDLLPQDFKSDKTCCLHAEQRAIRDAYKNQPLDLVNATLYFIRLGESGEPLHAGEPYCTICSKDALDAKIYKFVLWHPEGIAAYETKEYNERSFGFIPSLRKNV